jgi:UDP-N-acetylmuramoylalanine--D-glutamate ligase
MICGGHDKGAIELSAVKVLAKEKVEKMIVLTREDVVRKKLHDAFEGIVELEDHTDMTQAVLSARQQAKPGDKVLLSPMFASFDMFSGFEHRGKEFKRIVHQL